MKERVRGEAPRPRGTLETIMQAISVMYQKVAAQQLPHADPVIRPKVGYIGAADFSSKQDAVLEGEKAALAALPALNSLLGKLRAEGRL